MAAERNSSRDRSDSREMETQQLSILLVEDEVALAEMYRIGLERAGYLVRLATDGPSGLEAAMKAPPDLLLVDIRLPGLDRFQLLRQLREQVDAQDLPAVVLFNFGSDEILDRGRQLRVLAHFVKAQTPPSRLCEWIESWRVAHGAIAASEVAVSATRESLGVEMPQADEFQTDPK